MENDLISREALKKAIIDRYGHWPRDYQSLWDILDEVMRIIDNAPTVEERPQGEREFIEILAEYCEDDYDTLPEYKGKPCYSIHYRENGKEFVRYGTYKIEVLSEYLRNYFFSADMRGDK